MAATNYSCSYTNLYPLSRLGWDKCEDDVTDFIVFFPEYTPLFIAQRREAIDAADRLPDLSARMAIRDAASLALKTRRDEGVRLFGFLEVYIKKSFSADIQASMCDAAGKKYLANAKRNDWPSMSQLFSSALQFMDDYWTELTEKAKVTPAFLADFKEKGANFQSAYTTYKTAEKTVTEKGDEKILANNAIHADLMLMLKDAQKIYSDDVEWAKTYTFKALLSDVQSPKNAGVGGKIVQTGTKAPIKTAKITVLGLEKTTTVDDKGRFIISPLGSGKYDIVVEAEGYVTQTFKDVKIKTGMTTRLNVVMVLAG